MSPSMIDQLFRLTISETVPFEIEDAVNKFLPTKEDVQKKRRMHQDLWFFKDHYSVKGSTSYWTYSSEEEIGVTITDGWRDESVFCDPYNDRETQCIFANSFITWKDDLFPEQGSWSVAGREAYEKMLFDHDGEKTEPFRILTDTSEYVIPVHTLTSSSSSTPDLRNKGVFLGGGNEGDSYYTEHGQGLTILNIISRAMDGLYTVQWSDSGFRGDDTGEYENDVITIYKTGYSSTLVGEPCETFKKYIEYEHKKWSEDPEGEFTGLILSGLSLSLSLSNLLKKTEDDEELFSIFVRPDWNKIEGGYWGYQRDELVDGKIVRGPRGTEDGLRRKFRSQNEMAAALERGIVMSSEIR
jgi:hypothetical protein